MRIIIRLVVGLFIAISGVAFSEGTSPPSEEGAGSSFKHRGYHFGIGLAKAVSIGNDYNHYEKLFGGGSTYPEIWGEFTLLPIGWGFDLGGSLRAGYYRDSGKSAKDLELSSGSYQGDLADNQIDSMQKSILTMIPLQASLNLTYAPFPARFLVLNGWVGMSYTFIENTTQANLDSAIDQSDIEPFVNSGFNQERVAGVSMSFDVSQIDPIASYSLKVYGISGIFLTPFVQNVVTVKGKVGKYDRQVMGVMFSFETTGT